MKTERLSILPQNPARLTSKGAWARVSDREMLLFALRHFNRLGECQIPGAQLYNADTKPIMEALVYNGHARWGRNLDLKPSLLLIGKMLTIIASKHFMDVFGLSAVSPTPWTSDYFKSGRFFV